MDPETIQHKTKKKFIMRTEENNSREGNHQESSIHLDVAEKARNIPIAPKFTKPLSKNLLPIKSLIDISISNTLKKLFVEAYKTCEFIKLKYHTEKPSIVFEYSKKGKIQNQCLQKVISANYNFRNHKKSILGVYKKFYQAVDEEYYELARWLEYKKIRKQFQFGHLNKNIKLRNFEKLKTQFPIFYQKTDQKINFILFDFHLNNIQFTNEDIEMSNQYLKEKVKKFKKHINMDIDESTCLQDINGQIDSEKQQITRKTEKNQKKDTIEDLQQKVKQYLEEKIDLQKMESDLETQQLQLLIDMDTSNSQQQDHLSKLTERTDRKKKLIDMYRKLQTDISQKLDHICKQPKEKQIIMLSNMLKKLILSKKQLGSNLPIIIQKQQIFKKLNRKNLLIIQGETGSGKSTQLPQLLCQYFQIFDKQDSLPVLVTQPRKLATRTIAERVASELQQQVHQFVDYQTSIITKINEKSKIIFKLDRLVLDQIKQDPLLSKYSCLVIDQAHERTISIDILLGFVKKLLENREDFKVIVTSASMNISLFEDYFQTKALKISGKAFPVSIKYKNYRVQDSTSKIIQLIENQLLCEKGNQLRDQYQGHVLVFCSGTDQINDLVTRYSNQLNPVVFKVLPLHGKLTFQEQRDVFNESNKNKIIFCTRIAQTSITINKVKVVVDPGEDLQQQYNQKTKVTSIVLKKISLASAKQRAGRAGRTNHGFCFRLYSRQEQKDFLHYKRSQIQNMALDTAVLRLKHLRIKDIQSFPYIEAPNREGLKASIQILKMIDCLSHQSEEITEIGQFLIKMPIQPFLGRAIVESILFEETLRKENCFKQMSNSEMREKLLRKTIKEQIIQILSIVVNSGALFAFTPNSGKIDEKKFEQFCCEEGDFFSLLKLYKKYQALWKQDKKQVLKWCKGNHLRYKVLKDISDLERQMKKITSYYTLKPECLNQSIGKVQKKILKCNSYNQILLSCLITSFITNLALYSEIPHLGYTLISNQSTQARIYDSSFLSLVGKNPKWIICYDLVERYQSKYCRLANQVTYEFLKNNVSDYMMNRFQIHEAEQNNPFYKKIVRKLPTVIFQQFKKRYKGEDKEKASVYFNEQIHEIEFYFRINKNGQDLQQNFQSSIEAQIQDISKQVEKKYIYNMTETLKLQIANGFNITNIQVTYKKYKVYEIYTNTEGTKLLKNFQKGRFQRLNKGIKVVVEQSEYEQFQEYLNRITQYLKFKDIQLKIQMKEQKKVEGTRNRVLIYFWSAEKPKQNKLFLEYYRKDKNGKFQCSEEQRNENLKNICKFLNGLKNKELNKHEYFLYYYIFSPSGNSNGINCYSKYEKDMDEIQLQEILQRYHKNIRLPNRISMFRQIDTILSRKTEEEWQKEIKNKFSLSYHTNVRVLRKNYDNQQPNLSLQCQAEIETESQKQVDRIKQSDNQLGVLGSEKVHVYFLVTQPAVFVKSNVFRSLQKRYKSIKKQIYEDDPNNRVSQIKRGFQMLIKVSGKTQSEVLKNCEKIRKLFASHEIYLDSNHIRFLDKTDSGNNILESIEKDYNFDIYFVFNRKKNCLDLYCQDKDYIDIKSKLQNKLGEIKVWEKQISYRGKNLNKVKEVVDKIKKEKEQQKQQKQRFIDYQIMFKNRKVKVIGSETNVNEIENEIVKLVGKNKQECEICNDVTQKVYRLYECGHEFCCACLVQYVKQQVEKIDNVIDCPSCFKLVNVRDILLLLPQSDFSKFSQKRISQELLKKNPQVRKCKQQSCGKIFKVSKNVKICDYCDANYESSFLEQN